MKNIRKYLWDALAGLPAVILVDLGIWKMHHPSALIFLGLVFGAVYILHEMKTPRGR